LLTIKKLERKILLKRLANSIIVSIFNEYFIEKIDSMVTRKNKP
jgi:hypothetical protein